MPFHFENLELVRPGMIAEIDEDLKRGSIYLSSRLTSEGRLLWPELLADAAGDGDSGSLAAELRRPGLLRKTEESTRNGRVTVQRVPLTAPDTLAEGEFNRYYLRALALYAVETGQQIEIYRGRASASPRIESIEAEGKILDASELLADLRSNVAINTALGLPPGPNSGLTGRLV